MVHNFKEIMVSSLFPYVFFTFPICLSDIHSQSEASGAVTLVRVEGWRASASPENVSRQA